MKTLSIAALMFVASAAYAQQSSTVTPVSQTPPGAVLQVTPDDNVHGRFDVEIGAIRMTTHSGRYTLAYLPFLAPLQSTAFRPTMEMPNALVLTGTTIPQRRETRSTAIIHRR